MNERFHSAEDEDTTEKERTLEHITTDGELELDHDLTLVHAPGGL